MAPTFVQQAGSSSDGGDTTIVQAYDSNNAAGNFLVVAISFTGGKTVTGVTDTRGNTWSQAFHAEDTTNSQTSVLWYAPNSAAGANTVTVTLSASSGFRRIKVAEYSGVATASPLNGTPATNFGSAGTGTDAISSGNTTTTVAGCLIIGAVEDTDETATITAGTNFTLRGTAAAGLNLEDLVQAASGAIAATFTRSNTGRFAVGVAAFAPEGGTSASAEASTGTGTVDNAQASLAPTSQESSATAAGHDATAKVSTESVGATATASALDATVTTGSDTSASAETASAVADAPFDPAGGSIGLELTAENPIDATGIAHNATANTADKFVDAQTAEATGTSNNPGGSATADAGSASATAASNDPNMSVATVSVVAPADALANNATAPSNTTSVNAEVAAATGTANDGTTKIEPVVAEATATGTANDAAITVNQNNTSVFPDTAEAAGSIDGPSFLISVFPDVGLGTALAQNLLQLVYRFFPPTISEAPAGDHKLFYRYKLNRGITVLKKNGTYTQVRYPSQAEVEDADIAYIGGYGYVVDQAEKDSLESAGYTVVGERP